MHTANVSNVDIDDALEVTFFDDVEVNVESFVADIVIVEACEEKVENILAPKILFCELTSPDETDDTLTELTPPKVDANVTKKASNETGCRKHSRCHCNLFSKETDGFFALQTPASAAK